MALEEQPREDLLRDAVAYPRRLKLRMGHSRPTADADTGGYFKELFAGLRSDGSWSLYFDEDPVIQFTPSGTVRRLFVDNGKYRTADDGRLLELTRSGRGGRVELNHSAVTVEAERAIRERCQLLMQTAVAAIESNRCGLAGRVPADDTQLLAELLSFLQNLESKSKQEPNKKS